MEFIYQNSQGQCAGLHIYDLMIWKRSILLNLFFNCYFVSRSMLKAESYGFFVCRDFVWAWTFPYGAFYIFGKPLPSLGSQCHSGLLLHVWDSCILMSARMFSPLPWLQASFFAFAPVSVQCWDIIRLGILLSDWMSKRIIKWLSGYTQRNGPQTCIWNHYASRGPSSLSHFHF